MVIFIKQRDLYATKITDVITYCILNHHETFGNKWDVRVRKKNLYKVM